MHIDQVMNCLERKFTSGNSVPVERSTITRDEYESIRTMYYHLSEKMKEDRFLEIIANVEGMNDDEVEAALNEIGLTGEQAEEMAGRALEQAHQVIDNRDAGMVCDFMDSIEVYLFTEIDTPNSPKVKLTYGSYLAMGDRREACFHIHAKDMPPATAWMEESSGDIISDGFKNSEKFKADFKKSHTSALIKIIPEVDEDEG